MKKADAVYTANTLQNILGPTSITDAEKKAFHSFFKVYIRTAVSNGTLFSDIAFDDYDKGVKHRIVLECYMLWQSAKDNLFAKNKT